MSHKPVVSPAILFSEKVIREAGTGKLSIINSFQRFHGREFPFAVPPFIVSVTFTGLTGKVENLKLAVELVDAAGTQIIPPVTAEVSSDGKVMEGETFELSFFVPSCQFDAPGVYQVIFRVNDAVAGQRALPAALLPAGSESPAAPTKTEPAKAPRAAKGAKPKR